MLKAVTCWADSEHYTRFLPGFRRVVRKVIIHDTGFPGIRGNLRWLTTFPGSEVSAHYLIDIDGTVYQLVRENDIAWHAGLRDWYNPNLDSIGIELIVQEGGRDAGYTDAQMTSLIALCRNIRERHEGIGPHILHEPYRYIHNTFWKCEFSGILGHQNLNRGKPDPGREFDWNRLARELELREWPL